MSRNVKKTIGNIFTILKSYIPDGDTHRIADCKKRTLQKDSNAEQGFAFVEKSKIMPFSYGTAMLMLFIYGGQKYILMKSEYISSIRCRDLRYVTDIPLLQAAGIIAMSENMLNLRVGITPLTIIDKCLGIESDNQEMTVEFHFDDIANLFCPYDLIIIDDANFQLEFFEDLARLYAYIAIDNNVPHIDNRAAILSEMLLTNGSRSIAIPLINFMESNSLEFSFLQLYRCLEYLYIINDSIRISEKHNIDCSTAALIISENALRTWESDRLYNLLNCGVVALTNSVEHAYDDVIALDNPNVNKVKSVSETIYDIRCRIAHLRYNHNTINPELELRQWIGYMIEHICLLFINFDESINRICVDNNAWKALDKMIT